MTRLILAILVATALWPVDENNQMLGIDAGGVTSADIATAGYAVVSDLSGLCARNMDACETASVVAGETAYRLSTVLIADPQFQETLAPRLAHSASSGLE